MATLSLMQPTTSPETALLRIDEAGRELRVSRATVYRLIAAGELTPIHVGRNRSARIERADLAAYIARNKAARSA